LYSNSSRYICLLVIASLSRLWCFLKSHSCNAIVFVWRNHRSNRTSRKISRLHVMRLHDTWKKIIIQNQYDYTTCIQMVLMSVWMLVLYFIYLKPNEVNFDILKSNNSNERIIIYYVIWPALLVNQRSLSTR
jgi:hypothetical protein